MMPLPWRFAVFNKAGTVAINYLSSLSWLEYRDAVTGDSLSPPSFSEFDDGEYGAPRLANTHCGIVDMGSSASPRYLHLACALPQTFAVWATDGAPVVGAEPVWTTFKDGITGFNIGSSPVLEPLAIGSYIYRIVEPDPPHFAMGIINLGESASPRYLSVLMNSARAAIADFSPTVGSTIACTDSLSFDVTDDSGDFKKILLIVRFPDGSSEVVYGAPGAPGGFEPFYSTYSQVSAIANGYRFIVRRQQGWPAAPTLLPVLLDEAGSETP
jgi:hypothetical protein